MQTLNRLIYLMQVFAGRPFLWGLAVAGEKGSRRVLEILRDELDLTMALSGKINLCNSSFLNIYKKIQEY